MKKQSMALLLIVVVAIGAVVQPTHQVSEAKTLTANESGPTDPQELETWMDQFLADYVKRPSASLGFVLVKDSKIFFQKGYGYADSTKKTPVVPDQTLFYAASVSKLVT